MLNIELSDYFRLIAVLAAQVDDDAETKQPHERSVSELTLRKLLVWTQDPLDKMRLMARLIDRCVSYLQWSYESVTVALTACAPTCLSQRRWTARRSACVRRALAHPPWRPRSLALRPERHEACRRADLPHDPALGL